VLPAVSGAQPLKPSAGHSVRVTKPSSQWTSVAPLQESAVPRPHSLPAATQIAKRFELGSQVFLPGVVVQSIRASQPQ
jgi:hypothetical protein